ncbi:MAG: hypothetical protein ACOYI5_00090 [Christensenellales bacterium]
MKKLPRELAAACAVNAVVAGAAFSSGREVASFFACVGWASWIAVLVAGALFGTLMGMLCHFAISTGARNLPGIYYKKLDSRCGDAMGVVHALLMLMMGAVALSTAGELGMFYLDGDRAYLVSAGLALVTALLLTYRGMRPLATLGVVITPLFLLFFLALAIDPRPPRAGVYLEESLFDLRGNIPVAIVLGALFAFLKAAMAGGIAAARARGLKPVRFGIACGALLAAMAASLNWALQRAGQELWALNLPTVVLAARWGVVGYYISIYVMWLGCASVLACAIGSIMSLFSASVSRPACAFFTASAISVMSTTGLMGLVGVGYPMLGWICAISLGALAVFYEKRKRLPAPAQ